MITCDRLRSFAVASLVALAALGTGAPARAQAEDQATARALFNDARVLISKGHFDQACPKLEAASALYASSGVLLNLADCYEHVGRTASAWTEFGDAASAAERAGRADDKAEADRRQAAIEPRLSKLAIQVAAPAPGQVVKRDGKPLGAGAWGMAVPVDPGTHTVSAEAQGRTAWSASVNVTEAGKTVTVEAPELGVAAPIAPAPAGPGMLATAAAPGPADGVRPLPADASEYWTGRRIGGVVLAGAGGVGLGVGGLLGLAAKSTYTTAQGESGTARHDDSQSAVNTGNVATVVVLASAALAAGGLVVWLTAPSAQAQVGIEGSRLVVGGRF